MLPPAREAGVDSTVASWVMAIASTVAVDLPSNHSTVSDGVFVHTVGGPPPPFERIGYRLTGLGSGAALGRVLAELVCRVSE